MVSGFASMEGAYSYRSGMIVKEYIKVDPTKHSEELLGALPGPQMMK